MHLPQLFPIFEIKRVDKDEFVKFWSNQYFDKKEHLYKPNIGKSLTPDRLLKLFEWKNGSKIANHKLTSIFRNYIDASPTPPALDDTEALIRFASSEGGAIWRIFWLHCHSPETYPIFDQHVFRAMAKLLRGNLEEIPENNKTKAVIYAKEYLSFHQSFKHDNSKQLDEALWAYGKYLKAKNAL